MPTPSAPALIDRSARRIAVRALLLALIAAALGACQAPAPERAAEQEQKDQLLWPQPPERPRFAYEFVLRSAADIASNTREDQLRRALTGERPSDDPAFLKPAAVAARQGRIYVTDTANHLVVVFDVPRRRVFRFGVRDPGTLRKPVALALDDQGRVYVADAARREILIYDGLGLLLSTIGGKDQLSRPTGVAVTRDGARVYVIDRAENESEQHRVVVFDGAGTKLSEIGRRGGAPGEFNVPVQGAIGPDDTLYVLDAGNFRVQAFDREGRFLRAFGSAGDGLGKLARPRGLAVDEDGNVYVTDGSFGNFQIFDPGGRLLLAVGRLGASDRPGRFALPIGIAVDETRRVYVVDQLFSKVEVYRRVGEQEGAALAAPR